MPGAASLIEYRSSGPPIPGRERVRAKDHLVTSQVPSTHRLHLDLKESQSAGERSTDKIVKNMISELAERTARPQVDDVNKTNPQCHSVSNVGFLHLLGVLTVCAAIYLPTADAQVIYNFNSLTSNSSLTGQDNWATAGNNTGSMKVRTAVSSGLAPNNVSGNVVRNSSFGDEQLFRKNNGNFTFSLSQTATFVIEMQIAYLANNQILALSAPTSNTTLGGNTYVSASFGTNSAGFIIRAANFGTTSNATLTTTTTGGTWAAGQLLAARFTVDPTANSFNGSGMLEVQNLTLADGVWVTKLSGINLNLTAMAVGFRTPNTWDGLYLRTLGGDTANAAAFVDNLSIVPEPSTVGLIVAAFLCLVIVRWRRSCC